VAQRLLSAARRPLRAVVTDSLYGETPTFKNALARAAIPFVLAVRPSHGVWASEDDPNTPSDMARQIPASGGLRGYVRRVVVTTNPAPLPAASTRYLVTNLPHPHWEKRKERPHMEYRRLGNSGLKVSSVGLGGNTFGSYTDEGASIHVLHAALDLGITTIDTADIYPTLDDSLRGRSEQIIGRAVRGQRQHVELLTKVNGAMGDGPNDRGLSRKHVIAACEGSLRRLQTDYIDLYQVHAWDTESPLDETLRALDDLVRAGKVRYIGCSNFAAWQLVRALWVSERHGYAPFISTQFWYNVIERTDERGLWPACAAFGVGVIPYYPLARGLLAGKYRKGTPVPKGSRFDVLSNFQKQLTVETLDKVAKLESVARSSGKTIGQLAIAWLLSHPGVGTVIVGVTNTKQLKENIGAVGWSLDNAMMTEIEDIVA